MNESDRVVVAALMWAATHGDMPPMTPMQERKSLENLETFEKGIKAFGLSIIGEGGWRGNFYKELMEWSEREGLWAFTHETRDTVGSRRLSILLRERMAND